MSSVPCLQKSPSSSSLWSMRYLTPHIPGHLHHTLSKRTLRSPSEKNHRFTLRHRTHTLPCRMPEYRWSYHAYPNAWIRHRYRAGIYLLHKWRISHFSSPVFRSLSVQHFQDSTPFDKPSFHKQLQHSLSSQTRLPPRLFPEKNLPERLDFSPSILYH